MDDAENVRTKVLGALVDSSSVGAINGALKESVSIAPAVCPSLPAPGTVFKQLVAICTAKAPARAKHPGHLIDSAASIRVIVFDLICILFRCEYNDYRMGSDRVH